MTNDEHKPRVDAITDEPQTEAMQPTDADAVAQPEQPPMDDAVSGPDDEETHAVRQDIAETPPAG